MRITLPLFAVFGLILFVLAGCVSISQEECLQGDWYQLGQSDGQAGHSISRLDRHQEACQRVGVVVDTAVYNAGRSEGLKSYCTVVVGYQKTLEKRSYNGVCPGGLEEKYLTGQMIAQPVVEARDRLQRLESELKTANAEIDDAERRISGTVASLEMLASDDDIGQAGFQLTLTEQRQRLQRNRAKVEGILRVLPEARLAYERAQARSRFELARYTK